MTESCGDVLASAKVLTSVCCVVHAAGLEWAAQSVMEHVVLKQLCQEAAHSSADSRVPLTAVEMLIPFGSAVYFASLTTAFVERQAAGTSASAGSLAAALPLQNSLVTLVKR